MPIFRREFNTDVLAAWDRAHPGNGVRALFDRWALPGESSGDTRMLRVGIRDGYLNLYVKGQSVAKLSIGHGGPAIDVHEAYVSGRRSTDKTDVAPGQQYVGFAATALADPATAALIPNWITTAESYAGTEKRFVEDLIAANPGVIDLEMGLPASDAPGGDRVAPRMDLVTAQVDGEQPAIAFWEAKCANNPELRVSGDANPRVLGQLDKYVRWMAESGRIAQVREAYRRTAAVLLGLHALYRADATPDCLAVWRTLAATEVPTVIVQPGLVISNYWPAGHPEAIASG